MVSLALRRRSSAVLAGLGLVAATAFTATGASSAPGTVRPAIAGAPHYRVVGQVGGQPHDTTFSCQTTTPASCYGPAQIRAAYGVDRLLSRGLTGAGRTIVIIDAYSSPTIRDDLATFNQVFGLPAAPLHIIAPDGLTPFDQGDGNQVNWAGEITLDVEWSHAIAPGATIDLVLARSSNDADILSATRYAVRHNLGDVISQSFGEAEQCMAPALVRSEHRLFARASALGITLLASAGDEGAAQPTCDGTSLVKSASTPASDPYVTGVGGTTLDADGITGAYHGETVWNEPDFAAAGGGGFSSIYPAPGYQRSLRLPSRGVPDVAYNAAIIGGVLAVWSSSGEGAGLVFGFGGTSAGSPQWAGLVALADQLGHRRQGQLNSRLYAFAHTPLYGTFFHDVVAGNNSDGGITGFGARSGWDAASGLGSPRADRLVPFLALAGGTLSRIASRLTRDGQDLRPGL